MESRKPTVWIHHPYRFTRSTKLVPITIAVTTVVLVVAKEKKNYFDSFLAV